MNINQIQYFLAIVKTKSFSEAAYDLFISQSSISKQIKALEEELDVCLFNRNSAQRTLTPAGKIFYSYAKTVYEQHKEMLAEIDQLKSNLSTTLRLGNLPVCPMYLNFNIGADLALFQNNSKEETINYDIFEDTQSEIIKELYNHNADFALLRLERIPNPEDFDTVLVSDDILVAIVNKDHPYANKSQLTLKEIAQHPLFLLSKETELRTPVIEAFAAQGLAINIHGESPRPKIIQGMVTESMDISLLPKNVVDLTSFRDLRIIPIKESICSKLVAVRLRGKKNTELAQAFWEFICEVHTVIGIERGEPIPHCELKKLMRK